MSHFVFLDQKGLVIDVKPNEADKEVRIQELIENIWTL